MGWPLGDYTLYDRRGDQLHGYSGKADLRLSAGNRLVWAGAGGVAAELSRTELRDPGIFLFYTGFSHCGSITTGLSIVARARRRKPRFLQSNLHSSVLCNATALCRDNDDCCRIMGLRNCSYDYGLLPCYLVSP